MKVRYSLRTFTVIVVLLGIAAVLMLNLILRPNVDLPSQLKKYDDLSWHDSLTVDQTLDGTHIAIYLAWLCQSRRMTNSPFREECGELFDKLRTRQMTPTEFLEACDGVLLSDFMSERGMLFSDYYYDREYLVDFREASRGDANSWQLYDKLQPLLDKRYEAWEASVKQ